MRLCVCIGWVYLYMVIRLLLLFLVIVLRDFFRMVVMLLVLLLGEGLLFMLVFSVLV